MVCLTGASVVDRDESLAEFGSFGKEEDRRDLQALDLQREAWCFYTGPPFRPNRSRQLINGSRIRPALRGHGVIAQCSGVGRALKYLPTTSKYISKQDLETDVLRPFG